MKRYKIILVAVAGFTFAVEACYVANNPTCPNLDGDSSPQCPDNSGHTATCQSTSVEHLNHETTTGYGSQSSSGECYYTCHYPDPDNPGFIGCGSKTNSWNGTEPNSTACPSGSGSGGGGEM